MGYDDGRLAQELLGDLGAARCDPAAEPSPDRLADQVVGVHGLGQAYPPYVAGILQWYLPLVANVYFGIARRVRNSLKVMPW